MIDYGIAKGLSDQELQSCVKGQGAVPGWLALSELQSRNQLRASAPVQGPTGTVADSVLAQSGLAAPPQNAQQSPTNAPGSIAQPQPGDNASFATGGAVGRYADGGLASNPGSISPILQGLGMIPAYTPVSATATEYTPGAQIDPNGQTLAGAQGVISGTMGPSPDFQGDIDQVDTNLQNNGTKKFGLGDFVTNFLGNGLASKGNAGQAFGNALLGANKAENENRQLNFTNTDAANKQKVLIQSKIQDRQKDIEDAAQRYNQLQQTIADNEASRKAAIAQGNNEAALRVQEANNTLQMKRADLLNSSMKDLQNPIFSSILAQQAPPGPVQDFLKDLSAHTQAQIQSEKQASSDIDQKREMAVQNARSAAELQNGFALAKFKNDLETQGVGNVDDTTKQNWGLALLNDGNLQATGAPRGGKPAAQAMLIANNQMSKFMQENDLQPGQVPAWRQAKKNADQEAANVTKQYGNIVSNEDSVHDQLQALKSLSSKLQMAGLDINDTPDKIQRILGADGYTSMNNLIQTIPNEYATVMGKGQPTDSLRADGKKLINGSMSAKNMAEAADTMSYDMSTKTAAMRDAINNARYHTTPDSLLHEVKTGTPLQHPAVKALSSIPEGNSKQLDKETAKKILAVAAARVGIDDPNDPRVRTEANNIKKSKGYQ